MNDLLRDVIEAHPFFTGMKRAHLDIIAEGATKSGFSPGELILIEGEPANHFYVIMSGRVALEAHEPTDGTVPLQTLGAGDVLGWSWLFPPFAWHFRARAIEQVKVTSLDGAHLLIAAERDHDFGYDLMKRLAQVLIQRLQSTRQQLLERQLEANCSSHERAAA